MQVLHNLSTNSWPQPSSGGVFTKSPFVGAPTSSTLYPNPSPASDSCLHWRLLGWMSFFWFGLVSGVSSITHILITHYCVVTVHLKETVVLLLLCFKTWTCLCGSNFVARVQSRGLQVGQLQEDFHRRAVNRRTSLSCFRRQVLPSLFSVQEVS